MAAKQKFKQGLELWGIELRSNNGGVVTLANSLGLFVHANTSDRTYTFPDKNGTVAMISDLGGVSTTDDNSTNTVYYPLFATSPGGSTFKTGSTYLKYNPSLGQLTANSFVKSGGTSSQILKADGSVLTQTNAGTQFLRDDGSWQTISSSGGSGGSAGLLYMNNFFGGF